MTGLSLDDDEPTGSSLSLEDDDEEEPRLTIVVRLDPDSPYNNMPAAQLQGKEVSYKVTNVTDFDANTQVNPGPAYREITLEYSSVIEI